MKVAIYANNEPETIIAKQQVIEKFNQNQIEITDQHPDFVFSIGGDGTFIGAFHHYEALVEEVKFIGVHTGHLGFYTDWYINELDELIRRIEEKENPYLFNCPLLKVDIQYTDGTQEAHYVINEATIRKNDGKTQVSEVWIDDTLFEEFRGDGLCFSTPTGSTAYNKSIGGAIVGPEITAFQLAEIASLNNVVYRTLTSPMVIPHCQVVTVKLHNPGNTLLTLDQDVVTKPIQQITFSMNKRTATLACYRKKNFWQRVQSSFIGPTQH